MKSRRRTRRLRERRADWQLQDAKARLSELVRLARAEGPQRVTTRGADAVIVVSEEAYRRLTTKRRKQPKLSDVLASCPVELKIDRTPDYGRDIDLS